MGESSQEWVDGFLSVGNQPVLDLLNTMLVPDSQPREMLTDTSALVRWLAVSGLEPVSEIGNELITWGAGAEGETFLREVLAFRESLRTAVLRLEGGKQPTAGFLADLNRRLFLHPVRKKIQAKRGKMQSRQTCGATIRDTLWAALLHETERLLTETDLGRIRKCESCAVQFVDVSKKNARRWCSMKLCGNRIKVAAYQDRQRRAGK